MTSTVGMRIRQERKRLGLTQLFVARAMNPEAKNGMRVSKWERGLTVPDTRDLAVMLELGFNIRFLLNGTRGRFDKLVESV